MKASPSCSTVLKPPEVLRPQALQPRESVPHGREEGLLVADERRDVAAGHPSDLHRPRPSQLRAQERAWSTATAKRATQSLQPLACPAPRLEDRGGSHIRIVEGSHRHHGVGREGTRELRPSRGSGRATVLPNTCLAPGCTTGPCALYATHRCLMINPHLRHVRVPGEDLVELRGERRQEGAPALFLVARPKGVGRCVPLPGPGSGAIRLCQGTRVVMFVAGDSGTLRQSP